MGSNSVTETDMSLRALQNPLYLWSMQGFFLLSYHVVRTSVYLCDAHVEALQIPIA